MDVRSYLEGKGVRLKGSADNAHCACFFHGEDEYKRGRLYVNCSNGEEAGLYKCFVCDAKGNLRTLMRHFGDELDPDMPDDNLDRYAVLQDAAKLYVENMHPKVADWLRDERGLDDVTIAERQLGWAPSEDDTFLYRHLKARGHSVPSMLATGLVVERNGRLKDFLSAVVTLPYHVKGSVVQIRGKEMAGKYLTPPGQTARLFNVDSTYDNEVLVVTEGELDTMVMEQLGYAAVGVPGAKSWQDSWDRNFENVRIMYAMFDPDDAGREGAENLKNHLGPKVRVVDLGVPDGWQGKDTDPSALVVKLGWTKIDFDACIQASLAKSALLVSVDEAFDEWSEIQGVEGLKLGFEELDWSLRPGLLPAQVAVILAKTNTGKTIILLNTFQRMAMVNPDVKILFISLEQTRGDWFERARRIWNFYNLECNKKDVSTSTLDFWRPNLEMVDKNRVTEEQLLTCIDEYEARKGCRPDLVAVDYLGYWAAGFKGRDRYEKVSDAIMSLKSIAKEKRTAILAPHQVNRVADFGMEFEIDQARDSGAVEETADFVFGLWTPDSMKGMQPEDRTGVVHMKIGKSRHGGKGNKIDLQFGPLSLAMVPIEDIKRLRYAKDELRYLTQKDTWEQAIWRHRTGIQDISPPGDDW